MDYIFATLTQKQRLYIGDSSFHEEIYKFKVVIKENKIPVAVALGFERYSTSIGILILVNRKYQHKGYGKLALQKLIKKISKNKKGYEELIYASYKSNRNSIKLAKSCGFKLDYTNDEILLFSRPINISTPKQIDKLS